MNAKLVITIIIVLAAIYAGTVFMNQPYGTEEATNTEAAHDHAAHDHAEHMPATQPVKTSGAALIGGEFALTDQHNASYTHEDLNGQYSLVFFGFTHCPDMCPTALSNITLALDAMPVETAEKIVPILITVDPERDTPEVMKAYAENFHPSLVALSGSPERIAQAATSFKVFHQIADPSVEDYMVNHSGYIYVMNPQGEYESHFNHTTPPEEIAAKMQQLVQ